MKPMATNDLPDDPAALKALLIDLQSAALAAQSEASSTLAVAQSALVKAQEQNTAQQQQIEQLKETIRLLRHHRFGARSEKAPDDHDDNIAQGDLFDEAEAADAVSEEAEEAEEAPDTAPESAESQTPSNASKPAKPARGKRRPLPANLPRIRVEHDLPDTEKTCDCGCALTEIGEITSEQLDIIPAQIQVQVQVRKQYACRACENGVRTAPLPAQPIPKSNASPGLLAHICVAKYLDALPLHRQESIFRRIGVDLPRNTLASWMIKTGALLEPVLQRMDQELHKGAVLQCDETRVQVLKESGKPAQSQSYMWVRRGGPPGRTVIDFHYHRSRQAKVAHQLLGHYQGYLQTDDYVGYHAVGAHPKVTHLGCWAHARRKFVEAQKAAANPKKAKRSQAAKALEWIGQLYGIERQAKGLSIEARYRLRQEKSLPILDALRQWLDEQRDRVLPKGLTGQAMAYLDKNWRKLTVYTEDGRLSIDNNACENAIRPFVVGRKNWLFSATPKGADASAAIYSVIETAKANGLEPYAYLQKLFDQLPRAQTPEQIEALMPWAVAS